MAGRLINLDKERQRQKKRKKEAFKKYIYNGLLEKFGNIPEEMQAHVNQKVDEITAEHFSGKGNV
jgi:hypothetical protein